jgi:hypothetical protein
VVQKSKPIRRVVTGNDPDGNSCVVYDSAAPDVHQRPNSPGTYFNELWTFHSVPVDTSTAIDGGASGRPLSHSPPVGGGHLRIVQSTQQSSKALASDSAATSLQAMNATGQTERRDDGPHWNMHRTPTVDYGICLGSNRYLVLDNSEIEIRSGDAIIQLGTWHSWDNRTKENGKMMYVMMDGEFPDEG